MKIMNSFLQRFGVVALVLVVASIAATIPTTAFADDSATVSVTTINGQAGSFSSSCSVNFSNPISIAGGGTIPHLEGHPDQYTVVVDWGDGSQDTITPTFTGDPNNAFSYAAGPHTYANGSGLTHNVVVSLHHQDNDGHDNFDATSGNVCIQTPQYTITPSAGANGTISPNSVQTVLAGNNQAFTFTPTTGYQVSDISIDGGAPQATTTTSYTFDNVEADHTILVDFSAIPPSQFSIVSSAGTGGTISPNGTTNVNAGANQTFTFTPNAGYEVSEVDVDSVATTTSNSYTFSDVEANYTINVDFALIPPTTGTLTVIDNVSNTNGTGTSSPSDFTITITGGSPSPASFAGSSVGIPVTINGGAEYSVVETGPTSDYNVSYSSGCSATMTASSSATCTITNTDLPPTTSDLAITKTVDNATPNVGDIVTYTLTVTNNGPAADAGVVTTDALPSGVTYASSTASVGTYTGGTWNIGSLADNAIATLVIHATVNTGTGGSTINNSATVTGDNVDPNLANNTAGPVGITVNCPEGTILSDDSCVTPPPTDASLVITKTVSTQSPLFDGQVTYTLTVTNNGPATATNVDVTDALPTGIEYVNSGTNDNTAYEGSDWNIGSLENGATATLSINADVTLAGQAITNTATVTASNNTNTDTSASATLTATCPENEAPNVDGQCVSTESDLSITKTVDNGIPAPDGTVNYTITVTDNGPADATGVVVNDILPSGLAYVSSTPSTGAYNSVTGIWTIGDLGNSDVATLVVTATVDSNTATDSITNMATVSSTSNDPNSDNNTSSATINVTCPTGEHPNSDDACVIDNGSLTIIKTVIDTHGGGLPDTAFPLYASQNDDTAIGFTTGVTQSVAPGTYTVGEDQQSGYTQQSITCDNNGTLTDGATATVVPDGATVCTITNEDVAPSLTLIKSVNGGDAVPTDWTLTATGNQDSPDIISGAGGVTSDDTLQAGTYTLSEASNNSDATANYQAGDWQCTGDVENDGDVVTLGVGQSDVCTITNTFVSPPPPTSDLTITKSVDNSNPNPNQDVTYTITVTNGADSDNDASVDVTDQLPDGLTFVSADTGGNGTYDSNSGIWDMGELDADQTATLTIVAQVGNLQSGTVITNNATITTSTNQDTNDSDTSSAPVTVTCPEDQHADDDGFCTDNTSTLTIVKDTVGGDGTFDFNVNGVGDTDFSTDAEITTDGGFGTSSPITLTEGDYNVTENVPDSWTLNGVTCQYDDGSVGYEIENGEEISIGNDNNITCTFTNTNNTPATSTPETGTLIVKKVVVGSDESPSNFSFSVNGGDTEGFNANGENDLTEDAGTYTVTEPAVADFTTTYNNCSDVELDADASETCTITNTFVAPSSGGGGGSSGGSGQFVGPGSGNAGQVLGAATSTEGQVLGESCGLYMNKNIRFGSKKNNAAQVSKLQQFLDQLMGDNLPVTGFYGKLTLAAVKAFQSKYAAEILKPWGITMPTGIVYYTTLYQINEIQCPALTQQLPPLVPWSNNPTAQ